MTIVTPTRQQERRAASTNALLTAAGELVLEGGFAAMTFAAIGERAGYSRAMVTSRFGSRQGLIEELLTRIVVPWKEETYPSGHDNTGMESVVALIDGVHRRTEARSKEQRVLMALMFEAIGGEPVLRDHIRGFHRELRENLVRIVARGQTDGSIDPELDPAAEVDHVVSVIRGISFQWLLDGDDFDAAGALAYLRELTIERLAA